MPRLTFTDSIFCRLHTLFTPACLGWAVTTVTPIQHPVFSLLHKRQHLQVFYRPVWLKAATPSTLVDPTWQQRRWTTHSLEMKEVSKKSWSQWTSITVSHLLILNTTVVQTSCDSSPTLSLMSVCFCGFWSLCVITPCVCVHAGRGVLLLIPTWGKLLLLSITPHTDPGVRCPTQTLWLQFLICDVEELFSKVHFDVISCFFLSISLLLNIMSLFRALCETVEKTD